MQRAGVTLVCMLKRTVIERLAARLAGGGLLRYSAGVSVLCISVVKRRNGLRHVRAVDKRDLQLVVARFVERAQIGLTYHESRNVRKVKTRAGNLAANVIKDRRRLRKSGDDLLIEDYSKGSRKNHQQQNSCKDAGKSASSGTRTRCGIRERLGHADFAGLSCLRLGLGRNDSGKRRVRLTYLKLFAGRHAVQPQKLIVFGRRFVFRRLGHRLRFGGSCRRFDLSRRCACWGCGESGCFRCLRGLIRQHCGGRFLL